MKNFHSNLNISYYSKMYNFFNFAIESNILYLNQNTINSYYKKHKYSQLKKKKIPISFEPDNSRRQIKEDIAKQSPPPIILHIHFSTSFPILQAKAFSYSFFLARTARLEWFALAKLKLARFSGIQIPDHKGVGRNLSDGSVLFVLIAFREAFSLMSNLTGPHRMVYVRYLFV